MNDALNHLQSVLKQHGHSLTQARKAVFTALLDQPPQTITQLIARAGDRADRASIYRTVQLFEEIGVLQRLQIGWKYKLELSHEFSGHHHHLTCLRCHRIIEIEEDVELEQQIMRLAHAHDFEASAHQLELRGLCGMCKNLK